MTRGLQLAAVQGPQRTASTRTRRFSRSQKGSGYSAPNTWQVFADPTKSSKQDPIHTTSVSHCKGGVAPPQIQSPTFANTVRAPTPGALVASVITRFEYRTLSANLIIPNFTWVESYTSVNLISARSNQWLLNTFSHNSFRLESKQDRSIILILHQRYRNQMRVQYSIQTPNSYKVMKQFMYWVVAGLTILLNSDFHSRQSLILPITILQLKPWSSPRRTRGTFIHTFRWTSR